MQNGNEGVTNQVDVLTKLADQTANPQNENARQQASSSGDAVGEVAEGILDGALNLAVEAGSAVLQGAGNVAIGALECGGAAVEGVCSAAGEILGGL